MWNKNERDGHVDQAKGKVKQAVGDLAGNDKLKAEGKVDETVGKAKTAVGGAQKKVGAAIESLGSASHVYRHGAGVVAWAVRKMEEEGESCPSF